MLKHQFHSLFLESYLPSDPKLGPGLTQTWLAEAVRFNNPGKALEYSLHALCMTRIGRIAGDEALIVKGGMAYGHSLRELQLALSSPRLAGTDDTLATCLVLSIYEVSGIHMPPLDEDADIAIAFRINDEFNRRP